MDMKEATGNELLEAVTKGVSDVEGLIGQIAENILACANSLRVEQSKEVFDVLGGSLEDLGHLMEFVSELSSGLVKLNLSVAHLECWEKSRRIFEEMLAAFQRQDWVTFSDLIQYEFHPVLKEGQEGFRKLKEDLGV